MTLSDLRLRLRAVFFRRRVERDLLDELDFHEEMHRRKELAGGLSEIDAGRRRARRRFGSSALVADQCRDARGIGFIETSIQDIRYALRSFRRAPLFAATVVATIALGLSLNAAVFTIFNAYVLKPFAVHDPYSLYEVQWRSRSGVWHRLTWPQFEELRRETSVFSEVLGERRQLVTRIEGHNVYASLVTGNYFRMLGVRAALGRVLHPADTDAPGGKAVAVLSYDLWRQRFGADPDVVGRKLVVQGLPVEIVGVAREGFAGLNLAPPQDIWLPLTLDHQLEDGPDLFGPASPARVGVVGRLKPGVSARASEAALLVWAQAATRTLREDDRAVSVLLESRATSIPLSPMVMLALSPIAVAFGLVLLIACSNVANMMLARGMARQREIGIRLTLGAERRRLVRQLLTESILLAVPSGVLGFAISRLAIDGSVRAMFATLPSEFTDFVRVAPLPPDIRVFTFMIVAAVATAVLFGLAPALQTTRSNIVQMARGDFGSDYGPSRLRNALVVVQVTASVALLITASVLVRSAQEMARIDPGLRTKDVLSLDVRDAARTKVIDALQTHPLVHGLASASTIPFDGMAPEVGAIPAPRTDLVRLRYRLVSPSYFEVFDVPIVAGRLFSDDEARAGAPVAVVSESAAAHLWPGQDAIGHLLQLVPNRRKSVTEPLARLQTVAVIGVVRDSAADLGNTGPQTMALHLPNDPTAAGTRLIVRVRGDSEAARHALLTTLDVVAPGGVQEMHRLHEFIAAAYIPFGPHTGYLPPSGCWRCC